MRNSTVLLLGLLLLSYGVFGQKTNRSQDVLKAIRDCETCSEVIMIANKVEKSYTREWFESLNIEENYITFSKGLHKHYWDPNKVVFIERNDRYLRIYLD